MDLFFRGYDPEARITSGAQHLSAAAARFAVSIVRSIPHLPDSTWAELEKVLTVNALWSLCLILAGWLIATVVGGVIGLAVNAFLIAYGLVELWGQLKEAGSEFHDWAVAAYAAKNDSELDVAAQHFAAVLAKGGITVLELIVTHRVFRAVEGKLRERIPTPEWLSKQYEQAIQQREATPKLRRQETNFEKTSRVVEKLIDVTGSGVRYKGAKRAAEDFPTVAVAVGGALLVAGSVAVAAWAAQASARKVQS